MSAFEKEYRQLNSAQKQAVDSIDGPVLVVAGPGTGKTQLLSMRVANILKRTDTNPNEILCLTFTDKAVTNMKNRMAHLIGNEAHNVVTKTFHSFGAEIINSNPDYFWQSARLALAPDIVQFEIIDNILKKLPLSNPLALRFGGNQTLTKEVRDAFKHAKEAGLTPAKLKEMVLANLSYLDTIENDFISVACERISKKRIAGISEVIASLPDQDEAIYPKPFQPLSKILKETYEKAHEEASASDTTSPISRWKSYWMQKDGDSHSLRNERKRNQWWLEISEVYDTYRKALHERGYFDYSDMIIEVITQLEQNEDLLAQVQEQFLYVLIDEFQDTNEAQMHLAHLVSDHYLSEGRPNIMAVGDDDQAIFRFQGANLNNLLNFRRSYPSAKLIVLENNYRSSQSILDTSGEVIQQAEFRLVNQESNISKNLQAKADVPVGKIRSLSFETKESQDYYLAQDIQKKYKKNPDIAVIARSHNSLRRFAGVLEQLNIPIQYEKRNDVLAHPFAQTIERMAKLIFAISKGDKDTANEQIAIILRHPMWGIPPKVLWEIAVDNYSQNNWFKSVEEHPKCKKIINFFFDLLQESQTQPLAVVIDMMLGLTPVGEAKFVSPLRQYYISQKKLNHEYLTGLSAIHLLRSLVGDISQNTQVSVEDFLNYIDLYKKNNMVIADESTYVSGSNAVELLTTHKAKGLEFNSVYVLDCIESEWKPSANKRKPPINLPLRSAGDEWDDYVRLMYVALTRARSNITLSSYSHDSTGKELLMTPILSSVFGDKTVKIESEADEYPAILESALRWPRLDKASDEKYLLSPIIENYSLSVTNLLNFLDVTKGGPKYFFERNILRLPSAKTPPLVQGNAIHYTLEHAQHLVNDGSFGVDKIKKKYLTYLLNEHPASDDYPKLKDEGLEILDNFFTYKSVQLKKSGVAERKYKDIIVGKANINGKFDRMDISEDSVVISDYKTGRPLSNIKTTPKNEGIKAWNQRTQLIFYFLIASLQPEFKDKNIQTQMIYLKAENDKQLVQSYQVTKEDVEHLKKLINAVWHKIQNLDFPDTSNYEQNLQGIIQFENDLIDNRI